MEAVHTEQSSAAKCSVERSISRLCSLFALADRNRYAKGHAMKTTTLLNRPTHGLQEVGTVACWIGTSALLAVLLFALAFFAVLGSDSGQEGTIALLGRAIGPYLGSVALFTVALVQLAIALFAIGAVRWRFNIVRSPYWLATGVCTSLATLAMLALGLLYVLIATANV